MELNYWEKQLILYTKGHFGDIKFDDTLKHFPAELYGLSLEHVDKSNLLHMVIRTYEKLIKLELLPFNLLTFIDNLFRRARFDGKSNNVTYEIVLRDILFSMQGLQVRDESEVFIDLGEPDEKLKEIIEKEREEVDPHIFTNGELEGEGEEGLG